MEYKKNNLEKLLQIILPHYFTLVFLTTVAGALFCYRAHHNWVMADWLINYRTGMIRRGLLGEVIYRISYYTHAVNPGIFVVAFMVLFYYLFFFFSYKLLKKQDRLVPYAMLIFSPFIFTFQINDLPGGYRKEIIYLAFLAFIVYIASVKKTKTFEKIFYIALLFYPALILTHEMLAVFLPYLLIAYFAVIKPGKKKILIIFLLLLPSIVAFIATIHYHGTAIQVKYIYKSLDRANYHIYYAGAIDWLAKGASDGFRVVKNMISLNYLLATFLILVLSSLAYIPIYKRIHNLFARNKLLLLLLAFCIVGTILLFAVALDWGRFIYIHLVSIFLLSLLPMNLNSGSLCQNEENKTAKKKIHILYIFIVIVYSLFWYIPLCNYYWYLPHYKYKINTLFATKYKKINYNNFIKPYYHLFNALKK